MGLWDTVTIRDLYAKAEEDRKAVKGRNTWMKDVAEQKEICAHQCKISYYAGCEAASGNIIAPSKMAVHCAKI